MAYLLFPLNVLATILASAANDTVGLPHGSNITSNKSRKRQEIIFLRDDSTQKRNREGDTIANIEKHGKSLSAEGKVFKGTPKGTNYKDLSDYLGPALKEQSVSKDKGPPELQENEKKSDAYEVVSDGDNNNHASLPTEDESIKVVKVGHHKSHHSISTHASDDDLRSFTGHHRSGLHIVSLDGDDTDESLLGDKDARLYGSIGSPVSNPIRQKTHFRPQERESYFRNDYIPPNVVSVSQDALTGLPQNDEGQTRDEIFPIFRRRDPFAFSQSSQLTQPEELMQPFRPVNPKSISVGDRPNMFLLPLYNGRDDPNPALLPMTAQNAYPVSQSQPENTPMEYPSPPSTGRLNSELLFQPALQVPLLQTQSVNPSYIIPPQSYGQLLFNNQQPDARSLYQQLQTQQQVQIPQVPMSQLTQPQPLIMPAQVQMTPDLLSSARERGMRPASRWADEDGHQRSEVLDRGRDRQDYDRPQDERGEENEDYEEGRHESSRYYDRDEDSRREDEDPEDDQTPDYQPERSYSREEEGPSEEDGEDADEPEDESTEDATGRGYGRTEPAMDDEESPDSRSPDENDGNDQGLPPQQDTFATQRNLHQFNPQDMQRLMANRPLNFPKLPMAPNQMDAETFARYQLTSTPSALKEHILPKLQEEPKRPPNIRGDPNLQISEMSPAVAQYLENKATLEPNFSPPIASKDTIPGKSRRFRFGLGNVLIRLNGKPLEDSSQLRSKIINGQITQGKGKMIKSKGPVRVKLSHTKDAKHLKIIDIIAPKQFHVYDTKSKIRRPPNALNGISTTNKLNSFFGKTQV